METHPPEPKKAFLEKMTNILNYGALNLGMALGYQTGLFDVMDTFDEPQILPAIAEKSGLNSRYVAEWLGIMVSGDIVELSRDETGQDRFFLPVGLVDGGTGLGMMWGRRKAVEMLKAAGFSRIDVAEIPEDPFNLHYLCRK